MTGITPFQGYTRCLFVTQGRRASRLPLAIIWRAVGALVILCVVGRSDRLPVVGRSDLTFCAKRHGQQKSKYQELDDWVFVRSMQSALPRYSLQPWSSGLISESVVRQAQLRSQD